MTLPSSPSGITIGELKNQHKELAQAGALLDQLEVQKIESQNELLKERRAVEQYAASVGYTPSEADIERSEQAYQAYVDDQRKRAAQSIEGWADVETAKAERQDIDKLLSEYGLSQPEIAAVIDHRQLKLLRDYSHLLGKLKAASNATQKRTKQRAPGSQRKSSLSNAQRAKQAVKDGTLSRDTGIAAIIADGMKK